MQNKPQLFCFTHVGGTADFFGIIEKDLENVALVKLEYAGHGTRRREAFYRDCHELADDMYNALRERYAGGEYFMFGYSMGCISLAEVLKKILASDMQKPGRIFLAAHQPYTDYDLQALSADELDEWVKQRTLQFGAVPEKLLNNRVFWRTYLPIYRADYSILERYEYRVDGAGTHIPATVFYSETDTPRCEMLAWERYFPCAFHRFTGSHFFIRDHHAEMAAIMKREMEEAHGI